MKKFTFRNLGIFSLYIFTDVANSLFYMPKGELENMMRIDFTPDYRGWTNLLTVIMIIAAFTRSLLFISITFILMTIVYLLKLWDSGLAWRWWYEKHKKPKSL